MQRRFLRDGYVAFLVYETCVALNSHNLWTVVDFLTKLSILIKIIAFRKTSDARFFSQDEISSLELDVDKTTFEQLEMCFKLCRNENPKVVFD